MRILLSICLLLVVAGQLWANPLVLLGGGKVATGSEPDYAVSKCYVRLRSDAGATHFGVGIYNSGGTQIGITSATSIGASFPAWVETSITTPPTLTADQIYYVSVVSSGNYLDVDTANATAWACMRNTRGAWFDIPSTIDPVNDTGLNTGSPAIYCTNASGQVLLGSTTLVGASVNFPSSDVNIYSTAGNSCATLP